MSDAGARAAPRTAAHETRAAAHERGILAQRPPIPRHEPPVPPRETGAPASAGENAAPWIEGAVLAAVVLAILALAGEAARASYHGYLHAALGEAVLRDGLLPENPYHAGTPLRYYTLYPLLGALLGRIGFGPLWGFVALDVLAALLLPPALDALGRALGSSFRARRCCFLAAVLGFNGLGWLGFLAAPETAFGAPPVYALSPMTFASHAFGWDARLQAFLPKFLNVSSYAIALPFSLWALAACARGAGRSAELGAPAPDRTWSALVRASVSLALGLALNPLVGGFAAAVGAVWIAPDLLRGSWRQRGVWAFAGLAAVLLALPFLLPAFQRAPDGPSLTGEVALGGNPWSNLLGPLLVVLPLGLFGLRALPRTARWRILAAATLAAVLVLLGEMPQGNEYKMSRLCGLLWAIPAGAWAASVVTPGGRWRRAPIVLALLCVPTTFAVPRAYIAWGERAGALPLEVQRGRLAPRDGASRTLFAAESRADSSTVVVVPPSFPGARSDPGLVQGNALAPALAHALFVDLPQIHNDRLRDLTERLSLVEKLHGLDGDDLAAPALARMLAVLPGRRFLVLAEHGANEPARALAAAGGQELESAGGWALWSVGGSAR